MHILISNDDGIEAPGIRALDTALSEHFECSVFAPDRDRSGASNSLSLQAPIRVHRLDERRVRVEGTPTDCVHLAITGLLDREPDMVISGINTGANLGDDVIYSGTVAAAMEGRFLGLPAIAISLVYEKEPEFFDTAARVATQLVRQLDVDPLPADTILNVNVPDLPWTELRGFEVTRLGNRHRAERLMEARDPRGRPVYWIGPAGPEQDAGPGTDFWAIRESCVSITPIHVDLTRYRALDKVSGWVRELNAQLRSDAPL